MKAPRSEAVGRWDLLLLLRVAESVERLAGVKGVAGPSTVVHVKPRTFAQDDSVWVGGSEGADLSSRLNFFIRLVWPG